MTELLTLSETAERLHVSLETLRKLYRREGLPVIRVSANRYLVNCKALDDWLERRTIRSEWGDESGALEAFTESANTGAWLYPSEATSEDVGASSGSSRPRRGPRATYAPSSPVSVADYRQRKAT